MAVPKFFEFFEALLDALKDGETHSAKEVKETIAGAMNLTDADITELLPSGRQTIFSNRVNWAKTYLQKAELVATPQRDNYRITEEGKKAIASGEVIDLEYLAKYDTFKDFCSLSHENDSESEHEDTDESPAEILDSAYQQINSALASRLMDEVMKLSPAGFERLVVKLLLKMGYGNGIHNAGMVTQLSKNRPDIQTFAGALQGQQAQKGLFITTAKFSDGAVQFADKVKVVLIDGATLTRLMIKHNVGVSIEHTYEIKRVDSDFFSEEL